jgi:uncharacterized membrane protein YjdF
MGKVLSFTIRTIFNVLFIVGSIIFIYKSIESGEKDVWLSIPICGLTWFIIYSPLHSITRTKEEIELDNSDDGDFMCDC